MIGLEHLSLICLLGLAGLPVEIKPWSGPPVAGQLLEVSGQTVTIQTAQGRQEFELSRLWELTPTQPVDPPREPTAVWVELVDGSELHAAQFTVTERVATISWNERDSVTAPTRILRSVRWRDHGQTPDLAKQWSEITSQKLDADLVVVRRTQSQSLDQLEGVLLDVTPDSVQFEFKRQPTSASRKKLDGIVYYHPAAGDWPQPLGQLTDLQASRWNFKALRWTQGEVELVTVAGLKHTLPGEHVRKISLSGGQAVWLSELEPETVRWQPFEGPYANAPWLPRLTSLFRVRKDLAYGGEALQVGGTEYPRGLALRTRTELIYRLPEKFRQFHAVAGIHDREGGSVELTIAGDERELLAQSVAAGDPPRFIDLDLTGVKRLKIRVEAGERLRTGDQLVLGEARLIK